ncbi:MAG TPA: NAD(P)-dependent alcohol dehydrogenase [Candidatus Binatus sp.]|nr:NAD(P)-dependent alcohol dehydrogenase [Candidatus Binatus sp.]
MKAIVYHRYGSPDVLSYEEMAKPAPAENEVLIRVRAAAANPYDWHFMRGEPYPVRIMAGGLRKPKDPRLGADVAGEIEAVGRSITRFKPGDAVFGSCKGAFAEYTCASESKLAMKPDNVTFEQAASVPIAAFTALQGLRDKGKLQPGQKVLINGAAGGVRTFAVQIAKSFGAEVTGVCSTRNVGMVRSIGADQVVDYTQEDFTKSARRYDVILDCVGNHSFSECRRVLNPRGIYVGAGGTTDNWMIGPLTSAIKALVLSWFVSQKQVMVLAKPSNEDLAIMGKLMESGKVTPVIDRSYSLSEVPEAIRYLEAGHARGKVVITVERNNDT